MTSYDRIVNEASPALREMLAEIRAMRENLAAMAILALTPAAAAAAAAVARSKAKSRLTLIKGGKHHE